MFLIEGENLPVENSILIPIPNLYQCFFQIIDILLTMRSKQVYRNIPRISNTANYHELPDAW